MQKFWNWYERHLTLNISIAFFLFLLQIVHLFWLGTHVMALKLLGVSFFDPSGIWYYLILLVDYTEIPALISVSFIYINELRKGFHFKSALYLVLLASQFLHIFWITDEYVLDTFVHGATLLPLPAWLAWVAILIDYLEVPVIIDTGKRFLQKTDLLRYK